ncbi:MAG: DUF6316 family protein [Pseudomonadales bacterium]
MDYRDGENEGTFFRTDRFYCINCQWFFTTREGEELGPFETHEEAEVELMLYIRSIFSESLSYYKSNEMPIFVT